MEKLITFIILLLPEWERFWCQVELLVMMFWLAPLLTVEGIKVKMEEQKKLIDEEIEMYIMGEMI